MKLEFIKVWYDDTSNVCEIIPDGSMVYRIDYTRYLGFHDHDCYGLMIESPTPFDIGEDDNTEITMMDIEGRHFGFIYQCYVEDEGILSDITQIEPFHHSYIKVTNHLEYKLKLQEAFKSFTDADGNEVMYHENMKDIVEQYQNGKLCSLSKMHGISEKGVICLQITYDNPYGVNDRSGYSNINRDTVSWEDIIKLQSPYDATETHYRLVGEEYDDKFSNGFKQRFNEYGNEFEVVC